MPVEIAGIKLYTLEEVQEPFNKAGIPLSMLTLRAYARDGKIKGRKMGNRWYVSEEALRDYFRAVTGTEHKADGPGLPETAPMSENAELRT
jgi:hypothetical protein